MGKIVCRNPATGETIRELEATPLESLPEVFARARAAQPAWAALTPQKRAAYLLQLRETLINRVDDLAELISLENGKPRFEAMVNEVLPCIDTLTFFAKRGPRALKDRPIPMSIMKHRRSYLNYWPVGVVVIISPWNYPFLLPFAELLMGLAAGNAIVFKPSEITPLTGLKIQELCDEAGIPPAILQTLVGDGALGASLIQQKPDKIFFTGSVPTGKKIMAAAAEHLIPVNLELGGKDPMIVLPDADLDYATSAALWGAFSNSGQVCASTERLIVHEKIAEPFLALLKEKAAELRQGPSTAARDNDLGAITLEKQKTVYQRHLDQARERGATLVAGGDFSADRRYLRPTIVTGPKIEELDIYNEETFGPVLAVTTYRSVSEAIEKANRNRYGLLASVIGRDMGLAEQVARQLQAGTVTINEAVYTAGLGETPWGGVKDSGFGRTHAEIGLYEFVNVRHIHKPRWGWLTFKSWWWFPYTPFQFDMFRQFVTLYRRSWFEKLRGFPLFLWNFVKFLKEEPRI